MESYYSAREMVDVLMCGRASGNSQYARCLYAEFSPRNYLPKVNQRLSESEPFVTSLLSVHNAVLS
jgi:hypothetical protein